MVRNNKLIETLQKCVKENRAYGYCKGCFYGDGTSNSEEKPQCMLNLMNDILFFFGNPVPDDSARVLTLEELEEILSDRKDHLAFAEFISSIHVAKPVIRIVKSSGNFISLFDPQNNENDSFNKSDYYTTFRVWSTKPTDKLRNDTPWEEITSSTTDNSPINESKTASILNYVRRMT